MDEGKDIVELFKKYCEAMTLHTFDLKSANDVDAWWNSLKNEWEVYKQKYGDDVILYGDKEYQIKDLELEDPKFEGAVIRTSLCSVKEGNDV